MKEQNWYYALRKHNKISDRVRPITKPLIEAFDLAQFCYFSIDSNGNSVALSSYPQWMEYYMNQNLFTSNPFLKNPQLVPEGVYLAKGMKNPAFLNSLSSAESFGIQDSLIITFKSENKLTGFSFGLKSDIYKNQLLIKEIPLLKNYCKFFQKEACSAISDLEAEPVNIISLLGESFMNAEKNFQLPASSKVKLLTMMGIQNTKLSPREKQCLSLYLTGETSRSISRALGLSARTVESYLENIKIKLNCFGKTQLLKKAKHLFDSGYLSP